MGPKGKQCIGDLKGQWGDAADRGLTLRSEADRTLPLGSGAGHPVRSRQTLWSGARPCSPYLQVDTTSAQGAAPQGCTSSQIACSPGPSPRGAQGRPSCLRLADSEGPFQLQRPLRDRRGLLCAPAADPALPSSLTLRSTPCEPAGTTLRLTVCLLVPRLQAGITFSVAGMHVEAH